jgi:hypothetical protein
LTARLTETDEHSIQRLGVAHGTIDKLSASNRCLVASLLNAEKSSAERPANTQNHVQKLMKIERDLGSRVSYWHQMATVLVRAGSDFKDWPQETQDELASNEQAFLARIQEATKEKAKRLETEKALQTQLRLARDDLLDLVNNEEQMRRHLQLRRTDLLRSRRSREGVTDDWDALTSCEVLLDATMDQIAEQTKRGQACLVQLEVSIVAHTC